MHDPKLQGEIRHGLGRRRQDDRKSAKTIRTEYNLLEAGQAFNSELFGIARTLVRMADEDTKPNAERLREFGEAGRASLEQQLYSEAPIYPDLETVKLADSLGMLMEQLGADQRDREKSAGRQVAARPGGGAGQRHEAGRCRRCARRSPRAARRRSKRRTIR